ncbi:DUF1294 domain-containing protein [Candidatus Gracilibacteria bacterium]|nr:DUF1294 domain-containing protein [Candidatus Gracilibacteria bacterium]
MNQILIWYFVLINIVTFVVRGLDKWKARKAKWRISEKLLFILTLIGGFLGALIGMQLFRHKTIKGKFLTGFWLIIFLWIVLAIVVLFNI